MGGSLTPAPSPPTLGGHSSVSVWSRTQVGHVRGHSRNSLIGEGPGTRVGSGPDRRGCRGPGRHPFSRLLLPRTELNFPSAFGVPGPRRLTVSLLRPVPVPSQQSGPLPDPGGSRGRYRSESESDDLQADDGSTEAEQGTEASGRSEVRDGDVTGNIRGGGDRDRGGHKGWVRRPRDG